MKKSLITILALSAFSSTLFAYEYEAAIYCVDGKIRSEQSVDSEKMSSLEHVKERYPKAKSITLIEGGFKDIGKANSTIAKKYKLLAGDPCPGMEPKLVEKNYNFSAVCYERLTNKEKIPYAVINIGNSNLVSISKIVINGNVTKKYGGSSDTFTIDTQGDKGLTCDKIKQVEIITEEGGKKTIVPKMGGEHPMDIQNRKEAAERAAGKRAPSGGYDGNTAKKQTTTTPNPVDMMKKIF